MVAWSIWHNRNSVVFELVCRLPNHIWGFAIRYLHKYRMERVAVNKKQAAGTERWTPSPPGVFKVNVDGSLGHLYQGILAVLNSFSSWKIKHLKREHSKVAHELAHIARVNEASQVWVGDYPSVLLKLVQADCIW